MAHKRSMGLGGITNLAVMAPIKSGMVPGFEPISYLERLRKVLDALQSARQNVRESELRPPFFPDSVGRFGFIHHFRYAIVPPVPEAEQQPADGIWRLSLNVTFDGGWEPYMRVIYRDLGPLLDLLFCHSTTYPGSRTSTFDEYCAWVRRNELEGGLFFADSGSTLGDQQYLAEVEKAQREGPATDDQIAAIATPSAAVQQRDAMKQAMADPINALVLPLRTLKGLYRLSIYFPSIDGDMSTLRHFAHSILQGPRDVMAALDSLPAEHPARAKWDGARAQFADELSWFNGGGAAAATAPTPPLYDPDKLQSHILGQKERMTHGCVVLLRVKDKAKALANIPTLASLCGPVPASGIGYLIAFTYAGLKELGISAKRLDAFAQEFVDGMEARSALLGDLRGNHPDHWVRPLAYGSSDSARRIDMKSVHVFVQLRLSDDAGPDFELHDKLRQAVAALHEEDNGLHVLALQATRSYRNDAQQIAGHFGFADGLSQPLVATGPSLTKPVAHSDLVSAGELLLGHGNDRGDAPPAQIDPLRMDGSFLVVRKLRQRVDRLDSALGGVTDAQRDEVLAKMMGRRRDGTPLAPLPAGATGPNDFNYDSPAASAACPFHSHVRRANPRDGRPYTPRILRRGMSYGPKSDLDRSTERGVVFMAYCASIAEQFETIQRWVAGGNSSGVGSAQADPFLRVPQAGESSTFRYLDASGHAARLSFDDKPLVELEWGLYLFVPALAALQNLYKFREDPPDAKEAPPLPAAQSEEEKEREWVRQTLDDPDKAKAAWKLVRDNAPEALQDTAYGHLLGRHQDVLGAMKDPGTEYSVQGYGRRMHASIGLNLLGTDPGPAYDEQVPLNDAVEAIDEKTAFDLTSAVVQAVLAKFPDLPVVNAGDLVRRPIDLVTFSDHVMAALCTKWIGLPDTAHQFMVPGGRLEDNPGKPRCPGNFATASRYIFSPHPRGDVEAAGQEQGQHVRQAVEAWLQSSPQQLGSLAQDIKARLGAGASSQALALSLAGVLLGFPPTVQGNFIRTMETWIKDEVLWEHQQSLFEAAPGKEASYDQANAALRRALLATMRKRPVPEMLWRSPVRNGEVDATPSNRVVLGIASALTDDAAPDELMFGRDDRPGEAPTIHGCPGYGMGMGVLLAMTAGIMMAGTLRPTGSPVLLILTPA